jgi:hypothetical protein
MKLFKRFFIVILVFGISLNSLSSNTALESRNNFYSIQVGIFNTKKNAYNFLTRLPNPIKNESFIYKTDIDHYTVRIWIADKIRILKKQAKTLEALGINNFLFVKTNLSNIIQSDNKTNFTEILSYKYTFKELNFLSADMVLRGINSTYDFYVPSHNGLIKAKVYLKIKTPKYLRKNSLIQILVDGNPIRSLKAKGLDTIISFDVIPKLNEQAIKISVNGNLRMAHNICEDAFSDKTYMVISKDSQVAFYYKQHYDISSFIKGYRNNFCIYQLSTIPLAYYLSLINPIPSKFYWNVNSTKTNEKYKRNCKNVIIGNETRLVNNTLFLSKKSLYAIEKGYHSLLFGKFLNVERVTNPKSKKGNILSFRGLGLKTISVRGLLNLSYTIPFSISQIGGMPDTIHLRLKFTHTPLHQSDRPELRIYLNNVLIKSQYLEGFGIKQMDIKIPTNLLTYGYNSINVNLVYSPSSDKCLGSVPHSVLTIFNDSYLYWNSIERKPRTIPDFLNMLNGRVLLDIHNQDLIPIAIKLLNQLTRINKSIKYIGINNGKESKKSYDFIITLDKPENKAFKIYNPLTNKVIYQASYQKPFIFLTLKSSKVPQLIISQYGNPDIESINHIYDIDDYLNLFGNTGIFSINYMTSFEVGKKLKVKYDSVKGIRYYWNTYRLILILFLGLLAFIFILYVYIKLTRKPE